MMGRDLQGWLTACMGVQEVRGVLGTLTAERAQQLLLLRTSQRYQDRLAASLLQKAGQEGKFRRCARTQGATCLSAASAAAAS